MRGSHSHLRTIINTHKHRGLFGGALSCLRCTTRNRERVLDHQRLHWLGLIASPQRWGERGYALGQRHQTSGRELALHELGKRFEISIHANGHRNLERTPPPALGNQTDDDVMTLTLHGTTGSPAPSIQISRQRWTHTRGSVVS